MDGEEEVARGGEHRISIDDHVGREASSPDMAPSVRHWIREAASDGVIYEEVSSPAIEPSVKSWVGGEVLQDPRRISDGERAAESWIGEVEEKIRTALVASPSLSSNSYFRRSPEICKLVLGNAFCRPRAVAIGPYHRHERTSVTDVDKWLIVCLMNYLYEIDMASCLVKMKNQAAAALACYSYADIYESFDVEDDKGFAEILLLDSYFILFFLTCSEFVSSPREIRIRSRLMLIESDSPIASTQNSPSSLMMPRVNEVRLQRDNIMLDLLILDNQIPFFVIEELFKELKLEKPLRSYALEFFRTIHPRPNRGHSAQNTAAPKFFHLLDLFHWSRIPEKKYEVVSSSHCQPDAVYWARYTPTATELRKSATMFEKKSSGSSLDITFRRGRLISVIGKLSIPNLHIRDYSSFVFHNLIAFEMQCQSRGRCTMAFSAFMRNLLQSEEDVKLLRRCGILASTSMTDGQLVDFFKCLSPFTENYQMPSDLYAVYYQILSHHNRRISRFCGSVILQYFRNPLHKNSEEGMSQVQISVVDNASASGPAIESSREESWIKEVEEKVKPAFLGSPRQSGLLDGDRKPKMHKSMLSEEFSWPMMVTVGPFHTQKSTRIADEGKWLIVNVMIHLYHLDLAGCLTKIKNQVADALACYSDSDISQNFDSKDGNRFAEMLLLDSCYILFMLTSSEIRSEIE